MEYTVQKLGKIAGVSTRTLRYYDEIGILKPARISSSGYRIYGQAEVDRLQQILFYRELGVSLESIKDIVAAPSFDGATALKEHRERLLEKREQLDLLISNVDKTIALSEGRITMSDKEKFEGFKQKLVDDNGKKYGKEIREKYGNETVNKSNAKVKGMTQEQYEEVTSLANEVDETLHAAFKNKMILVASKTSPRRPYVDTVGRNKKAIENYIKKQLQEDIASAQISLKEFIDPFTGEPVDKNKKK